jgi:hypothetical protein
MTIAASTPLRGVEIWEVGILIESLLFGSEKGLVVED